MTDQADHLLVCETEEDRRLARIIVAVLDARDVRREDERIDPKEHKADHEFVQDLRVKKQRWDGRVEKVKGQALGSLVLSMLTAAGAFLYWLGKVALEAIIQNPPHGGGHP